MISIYKADKETTEKIIEGYKNGTSMRELERLYNVNRQTISQYLEEKKIKTTKGNHFRKYTHDFDFFETIDTEEKAYWLGFMFADGYIVDHSNRYGEDHFGMTLHKKDTSSLEAFKKSIKATNPITDVSRENRQLSRLLMTSQKTVDDLISHGCVKQKSLILEPPIGVPEELIPHFIRGFFDGDGSIFYNKTALEKHPTWKTPNYTIEFTTTLSMAGWLRERYKVGKIYKEVRREKTYYYRTNSNKQSLLLANEIYKDATIYMERKYNIYQDLVKISGN